MESSSSTREVAILKCPGSVNWGPIYMKYFSDLSAKLRCTINLTVLDVTDINGMNKSIAANSFSSYIITGCESDAFDNLDWILNMMAVIKQVHMEGKTLIGICFGHQIIGRVFGGSVSRNDNGWGLGPRSIDLCDDGRGYLQELLDEYAALKMDSINYGSEILPASLTLHYVHADVVSSYPVSWLRNIGGNEHCSVGGFFAPAKGIQGTSNPGGSILTVQGHPEFNSEFMIFLLDMIRGKGLLHTTNSFGVTEWVLGYNDDYDDIIAQEYSFYNSGVMKDNEFLHSQLVGKCMVALLCR